MSKMNLESSKLLEEIYEEFGEQICLYSYLGGYYDGQALFPCTEVKDDVEWIVTSDIKNHYSSPIWTNLRKHFASKTCHEIHHCKVCSYNEKNNFTSSRQAGNRMFTEIYPIGLKEALRNVIANDYKSSDILYLHWFPSSYCNYECIMCSKAASTRRDVFEKKHKLNEHILPIIPKRKNEVLKIIENVNGIGLTGGETILQPEVHEALDHLISIGRAHEVRINLLTNASSFPDALVEKFKKFKEVIYSVSVDGTNDNIEYQRRGCKWETVAENTIKIRDNFPMVINYVLTAVSVFSVTSFLQWAYANKFDHITFFPVKDPGEHLGLDVMPDHLKKDLLQKFYAAKQDYLGDKDIDKFYYNLIESVIKLLEKSTFNQDLFEEFKVRIKLEDTASKKPLVEVVPEWKQYFE